MDGTTSSTSSLTSTSHTLTHAPGMASRLTANGVPAFLAFLDSFEPPIRHKSLQPPISTPNTSLQLAKDGLDSFVNLVSDEQQARLEEARRDRKRKRGREDNDIEVLKVRELYLEGFQTEQTWEQAKRIMSSALHQSNQTLQKLEKESHVGTVDHEINSIARLPDFGTDGVGTSSDGEEGTVSSDNGSDTPTDIDGEEEEVGSELDGFETDDDLDLEDAGSFSDGEGSDGLLSDGDHDESERRQDRYVEDPDGLNDGFFSIDDFNKQTQWLEDQDARADPNTDALSDEEAIDWHGDIMSVSRMNGKARSKRPNGETQESDEELAEEVVEDASEEEDGPPIFGDVDLFAPEGASEDEMDEMNGDLDEGPEADFTANDIFYKDFFAPPAKKAKKGWKPSTSRSKKTMPTEDDVNRAMSDVRRDLFEDMSDNSESDGALSDVENGNPKSRKSATERRQAKLLEEIRKLEAAAVKERAWTMTGEASAGARPLNATLEEDLDFEYSGKPVPVITPEVNETIEDLVKRRIVEAKFDEVIRRHALDEDASARRGMIALDDSKGQQSLADIYAEEHVKNSNSDAYVSKADEKLRAEEAEVERMWKDVSAKLDALSSWHYKPRPTAPQLTVVADVATVTMEDAQPTTAQGVGGGDSMMAPQEVYRAGKESAEKGEVVTKSGLPVARQEMTREDKTRRRRRQKERIRKSGGDEAMLSKKALEKKKTVAELKRSGVKVINRQGEIVDVDGNKPKAGKARTSGSFKL
jgi:U3 small nucleolar RNA-associated protein MPP10